MKRRYIRRHIFPRKKSTQTPWKIEPLKEVDSLEEATREGLSCSICMDYLSVPHTTPCGHVFCYLCIFKWLEKESICPQCRKNVEVAPYPVYLLSNQVDQALLKFPDPNTKLRIGKEFEYYKSFSDPWVELFSSSMTFWDDQYSSSDDDEPAPYFYTDSNVNFPYTEDPDTTEEEDPDNESHDTSDSDEEPVTESAVNSQDQRVMGETVRNVNIQASQDEADQSCSSDDSSESSVENRPPVSSSSSDTEPVRRSRRLRSSTILKMSKLKMSLAGNSMLGRLVDQLQPVHLSIDDESAKYVKYLKESNPVLSRVDETYSFGDLLSEFQNSDVNILNLETAITTESVRFPKAFNYRMHPQNIDILKTANISYVSLANNHILDYGKKGMLDTMYYLSKSDIAYAGVGKSKTEAIFPTYKYIKGIKFAFLSASDHPQVWSTFQEFNYQNVENPDYFTLSAAIKAAKESSDFVIFSFHWGPNYQWFPDANIRRLARSLIDFGVDLIHGHSSHHIQGIEIYKGKPIFYGMGDFVDDYAVDYSYRNDLSFLYQVEYIVYDSNDPVNIKDFKENIEGWEIPSLTLPGSFRSKKTLCISSIKLIPTSINLMQVNRISPECKDFHVLYENMSRLCFDLGTKLELKCDPNGKPIVCVAVKKPDIKH